MYVPELAVVTLIFVGVVLTTGPVVYNTDGTDAGVSGRNHLCDCGRFGDSCIRPAAVMAMVRERSEFREPAAGIERSGPDGAAGGDLRLPARGGP